MSSVLRDERLAQATYIRMVERLKDADFPRERLEMLITAAILVGVVPASDLVAVYDLDGPPLARLACHGSHDGGEGALAELVRHVVVRVDACELKRREVPVYVPVVLERVLLRHRRPKRDLVSVAQDTRLALLHARAVDLRPPPRVSAPSASTKELVGGRGDVTYPGTVCRIVLHHDLGMAILAPIPEDLTMIETCSFRRKKKKWQTRVVSKAKKSSLSIASSAKGGAHTH